MWAMKVAYYRAFQKVMKIFMMFLDWSEPQLLTGPGAIKKLPGVIKDKGINNVMIVTDKGLMSLHLLDGLFKQLEEDGISYTVYDGVQPNPSIENIEEARLSGYDSFRRRFSDGLCKGCLCKSSKT